MSSSSSSTREQVAQHPGHRQKRRARVEAKAVALEAPGLAAGRGALLEHGDRVAGGGQARARGEAADPGSAHDDPHRRCRRARLKATSAGTAKAPIASPPAAATRGSRHTSALAAVSPVQVHAYSASAPPPSQGGSSSPSASANRPKIPAEVTSQPAKFEAGTPS